MFFVGPNGSGKSRFAEQMKALLPNCRILGTDRLSGMERVRGYGFLGDNFAQGFQKNWFDNFKTAGRAYGSGIDTIPLLEERLDIRIKVEATLSHLFGRIISLEWDSGNLIPRATLGTTGQAYRLDTDECHGIKELLILLSHLYNDDYQYLIIDEPELNLHPQFQAFFMQEVRKVAGNPLTEPLSKCVILITHSPFILDFKDATDLTSIISFSISHGLPQTLANLSADDLYKLRTLVPRINVHHKQLFFSDNPIFVEGIFDAQIVQAIQNARGVSIAGAGSCIIDAGGCEEVNKYLLLCQRFGKKAFFLYDLDSFFRGALRGCVQEDSQITSFLARLGVGASFGKYCGELDRLLTRIATTLVRHPQANHELNSLQTYLMKFVNDGTFDSQMLSHVRLAVVIEIERNRDAVATIVSDADIADVEGRMKQIGQALMQRNVILLTEGVLENFLPSYNGNPYYADESIKGRTVAAEIDVMAGGMTSDQLASRYRGLYQAVCALPAKSEVDFDSVLNDVVSQFILDLQSAVIKHPSWNLDQMRANLFSGSGAGRERILTLRDLEIRPNKQFVATLVLKPMFGSKTRTVHVSHETNAGMRNFQMLEETP